MKLLNRIIDKLQETFPPNRIAVLLTPLVFIPIAGSVTAWLATHFPGLDLSEGAVIGLAGAAALSAFTLGYKWLDQWQRGEEILDSGIIPEGLGLVDDAEIVEALNTFEALEGSLADLRARVRGGTIDDDEIAGALKSIGDVVVGFLQGEEQAPAAPPAEPGRPPAEQAPAPAAE